MIEKVLAQIDADREASDRRLLDFLRIPSVSTDPEHLADIRAGAEWVHQLLSECGFRSEIVETAGHPAVIAEGGSAEDGAPTVLIYGHYDVQPAGDPSLWESPAFEPAVRNGRVFARGAADDKGQVLAHLLAAQSWMQAAGTLPCRVKFLVEGEEEIGSPNLEAIVREHRRRLSCDYVALSDTPRLDEKTPAITYGTKGLVYKEMNVYGPKQNLHSGSFGGTLTNPGNALASIIASLRDADNKASIPGFYDNVRGLSDTERALLDSLPFDEAAYGKAIGVPSLHGEQGFSTIERRWARPTLDVNGLFSGFVGDGASTIIPAKAMGKVSMRLVPDQSPDRISKAFDEAVRAATPPGVRVEITTHAQCAAYLCPLDSPGINAAKEAMGKGFGVEPVFIREGGSLPILPLFKEVLGADSLMLGFCDPTCNAHGPNEFFDLADLYHGTRASAYLLEKLSRML